MRRSTWIIPFVTCFLLSCVPIHPEPAPPPQPQVAAGNATAAPQATEKATIEATEEPAAEQPQSSKAGAGTKMTPKAALDRLFSADPLSPELFAPDFLNQVSVEQIQSIIASIVTSLGDFERVEGEKSPFTLIFPSGTIVTDITLQDNGQIESLFFHPPTLAVESLDQAVSNLLQLPGEASLLVRKNGEQIAALEPNRPLAVGSAFKLAVLKSLRTQIEAGDHSWDEVILLQPQWKSLPTGVLQSWPDDTPLTLQTLATLMISISDNTAADALIATVGRPSLEAISPRNQPFLTVRELLQLKSKQNLKALATYRDADEASKRQLLQNLESAPLPALDELSSTPILDVEWHFTSEELCDLMAQLKDLDLMTVEPGPAGIQPGQWSCIAFKGGSDRGVLNLTSWLETQSGDSYCVSLTENVSDQDVDENQVVSLYRSLLSTLK